MARQKKSGSKTGNTPADNFEDMHESMSKLFGDDDVRPLSSADSLSRVGFSVSSRSIVVDKILAGGRPTPCSLVPFGRQMEVSGLNGSGKTTLCAQTIAETQARGGIVIVTDTEDRIDHAYWEQLGVDTSKVLNVHATTIEDVFNKHDRVIRKLKEMDNNQPCLILWDSVGGTSANDVVEGKGELMERAKKMYGKEAKLIGMGVKALNPMIASSNVCYLYTNHVYTRLGVTYGDPMTEYGGEKLRFHATVRLRITKIADLKVEDDFGNKIKFGQRVKIKANKNSMGPMMMEKEAVILGGKGFSNEYTVFEIGKKSGLIKVAGAWSTATFGEEEVKFQGWDGFLQKVVTHPLYPDLVAEVMEIL